MKFPTKRKLAPFFHRYRQSVQILKAVKPFQLGSLSVFARAILKPLIFTNVILFLIFILIDEIYPTINSFIEIAGYKDIDRLPT